MKDKTKSGSFSVRESFSKAGDAKGEHSNALQIDFEKYMHFLDDPSISDAQKQEFIETIWSILLQFVDLGFGIHPIQQVIEEYDSNNIEVKESLPDNKNDTNKCIQKEFEKLADGPDGQSAER
ncbi:hypothetical protein HEP89_04250 [Labrenzia sp. 5N]|uniref:hypothetical protein n=1 Tax=Labrenzia sp. 5N TaxID=2723402 RepID=UPI001446AD56|nr:hypothetical protein [Labrenzia sp. 5N]NKX63300.1 hypothetical protein [Labrenzia sp. 5N]